MCGCGGRKNINVMQIRRQNMARRNRMANNQQINIQNTINQSVPPVPQVNVQPRQINFPRRLLGLNRRYPFLVRRRNW
jgi:hypothetical protein